MRYFRAEDLTKTYVTTPIVDHITFSIEKWKKIALVAKNGWWKTTLIKLMMGNLDVTEGSVEWRKWIKIGYLSQDFNLNSEKTVAEEVFETDHKAAWLIKQYEELMYSSDSEQLTELIPLLDEFVVELNEDENSLYIADIEGLLWLDLTCSHSFQVWYLQCLKIQS